MAVPQLLQDKLRISPLGAPMFIVSCGWKMNIVRLPANS